MNCTNNPSLTTHGTLFILRVIRSLTFWKSRRNHLRVFRKRKTDRTISSTASMKQHSNGRNAENIPQFLYFIISLSVLIARTRQNNGQITARAIKHLSHHFMRGARAGKPSSLQDFHSLILPSHFLCLPCHLAIRGARDCSITRQVEFKIQG